MSLTNGRRSRKVVQCLRCGNAKFHEARGLCKCCYNHLAEGRCKSGESLDSYALAGGFGSWVGASSGTSTQADRIRRTHDPRHIPMREAG